jgi:hypothetical protein
MEKISNLVEQIFATAVALDQSGGLKNTIYAIGNEVFIMNYDHTVILRFKLRSNEANFEHPISFKANDYDSNQFEEKDGRITFHSSQDGYKKKKICGTTDLTPEEVKELFEGYLENVTEKQTTVLTKGMLPLMEEGLSHIEFFGENGSPIKMVQRNIYTGGITEIEKAQDGFFKETLTEDFGPVALKTADFQSLFTFQEQLKFQFPTGNDGVFIIVKSLKASKRDMVGIIACCLYDEIINLRAVAHTPAPLKRRK